MRAEWQPRSRGVLSGFLKFLEGNVFTTCLTGARLKAPVHRYLLSGKAPGLETPVD